MRHEPGPIGTYNAPSKDADCENKEVIDQAIVAFWELVTVTVPEMSDTSHGRTALTQLVGAPMGGLTSITFLLGSGKSSVGQSSEWGQCR